MEEEEEEGEDDGWSLLPYILLEDIFVQLHYRHRYYASMACHNWCDAFKSPRVWYDLNISTNDFTHGRFYIQLMEYQREFDPYKFRRCLQKVGEHFRSIVIKPIPSFYTLGKCLEVLSSYINYDPQYPMPHLRSFKFTFPCEWKTGGVTTVFGTGGEILEDLKELLRNLRKIEFLSLNHLLLERDDAPELLEDFNFRCGARVLTLELVNVTKLPCTIPQISWFEILRRLVISPQNINDETVIMLAQTPLRELVIVQDRFTPEFIPVVASTWIEVKEISPALKVKLVARERTTKGITLQPRAPVYSVIYDTPYARVTSGAIMDICDHYRKYLDTYGHLGLPKVHGSRSFHERADSHLVFLARQCPNLRTLVVTERVSTATLLIIASHAKKLKTFVVRRNAVLKKCDWPQSGEWSDGYYQWLRESASSYEATEREIRRILQTSWQWRTLTDFEFRRVQV